MNADRASRVHVLRETTVSVAINAAFSALFVFLVFGRFREIGLWGVGGLALDSIPQTFIICLMSVLVPSAITRKALRKGKIKSNNASAPRLPRNLFMRSILIATLVSLVAVPVAVLALALTMTGPLPFAAVLPMKIAYGALLAGLVTSFAIRAELAEGAGA